MSLTGILKYFPDTFLSCSDFESPNLLAVKRSTRRPQDISKEVSKQSLRKEVSLKSKKKVKEPVEDVVKENVKPVAEHDSSLEIIEPEKEKQAVKKGAKISPYASPLKKEKSLPKSVKVLNRWGMDVDDITESQKKRLKNQKQSKIDGFFKNPPKGGGSEDNFKRISHADTDMERALKLSR